MFGRNGAKGRSARPSRSETAARAEGKLEAAKIREQDAQRGPRPVHLVEDRRLGVQK
jgi:hypothetical protein